MKNTADSFIQKTQVMVNGLSLFASKNAIELSRLLLEENKKILGIDGIFVNTEGTRPSMEDSFATHELYTKDLSKNEIEKAIEHFINSRASKKNLLFEVVF